MEIATGAAESHPGSGANPLPYDPSLSPGVGPPTAIQPGQLTGPTYPGRNTTGEALAQMAAGEADCRAAQAAGMDARNAMLGHYQAQALPLGGHIGDDLTLPVVPPNAVPTEASDAYPFSGLEPTPAYAGEAGPLPQ